MSYDEAVAWLYATQLHGIHLGLENIRRLVTALGIRVSGPDAPRFLHVAGTNGKGSVCAMLDACCRAAGLRTGLFVQYIPSDKLPILKEFPKAVGADLTALAVKKA